MIKFLKISLFVSVLFAVMVYAFMQRGGNAKDASLTMSVRDYLLSEFLAELPLINSKLPHQVDAETILHSVEYDNNRVVIRYELSKAKYISADDEAVKYAVQKLREEGCREEGKRSLINVDIEFLSRYQNSKGATVFEVYLDKAICSKLMADG